MKPIRKVTVPTSSNSKSSSSNNTTTDTVSGSTSKYLANNNKSPMMGGADNTNPKDFTKSSTDMSNASTSSAMQRSSALQEDNKASAHKNATDTSDFINNLSSYVQPQDINYLSDQVDSLISTVNAGELNNPDQLATFTDSVNSLSKYMSGLFPHELSLTNIHSTIQNELANNEVADLIVSQVTSTKEISDYLEEVSQGYQPFDKNTVNNLFAQLNTPKLKSLVNAVSNKKESPNTHLATSAVSPDSPYIFEVSSNDLMTLSGDSQLCVMAAFFSSLKFTVSAIGSDTALSKFQQELSQLFTSVVGFVAQFNANIMPVYDQFVSSALALNFDTVQNAGLYGTGPSFPGCYTGAPGISTYSNGMFPGGMPSGNTTTVNTNIWGAPLMTTPPGVWLLASLMCCCVPAVSGSNPVSVSNLLASGTSGDNNVPEAILSSGSLISALPTDYVNGSQIEFYITDSPQTLPTGAPTMLTLPSALFNLLPSGSIISSTNAPSGIVYMQTTGSFSSGSATPAKMQYAHAQVPNNTVAMLTVPQMMSLCTSVLSVVSIITPVMSYESLFSNCFGGDATITSFNSSISPLQQAAGSVAASTNQFLTLAQQLTSNLSTQLQLLQTVIQNFKINMS